MPSYIVAIVTSHPTRSHRHSVLGVACVRSLALNSQPIGLNAPSGVLRKVIRPLRVLNPAYCAPAKIQTCGGGGLREGKKKKMKPGDSLFILSYRA